jgi:hypothetical protein
VPEFAELVVMPCTYGKTRQEAIRHGYETMNISGITGLTEAQKVTLRIRGATES